MKRGGIFSAFCIAALMLAPRVAGAPSAESLEYAVKATFLYKFAGFVEWPLASFETATSPVTLCVLGNDPVASLIDQAAAGRQMGERPIAVRHLQMFERNSACHILYVPGNMPDSINAARGTPVLTVTDSAPVGASGSIVTFVVQDNRVRFDIDDAAAAQNNLAISSKLLSLARVVRPRT